jgi:hypothetical protein
VSGKYGSSSGFTTDPATTYGSKYFDIYNASSTKTSYSYRILGDATGEMGPFKSSTIGGGTYYINSWYSDSSYFVDSSYPWFIRGGACSYGVLAGQFFFERNSGAAYGAYGFRLVLAF